MNIRWITVPEQYEEFIMEKENLIGGLAEDLMPVMGELGLKFIRIDGIKADILIAKK